jgi:hypothetical protein
MENCVFKVRNAESDLMRSLVERAPKEKQHLSRQACVRVHSGEARCRTPKRAVWTGHLTDF